MRHLRHVRVPTLTELIFMPRKLYHWDYCTRSLRTLYMEEMDKEYSDVGSSYLLFWSSKLQTERITQSRHLHFQPNKLSPRLSHQLVWSRFVNTSGKEGSNVPCDLHMEHLNRVLKDSTKHLQERTKQRQLSSVLENVLTKWMNF